MEKLDSHRAEDSDSLKEVAISLCAIDKLITSIDEKIESDNEESPKVNEKNYFLFFCLLYNFIFVFF